jgi:16S rRNA (cytosine967-C5)-methyltransferase
LRFDSAASQGYHGDPDKQGEPLGKPAEINARTLAAQALGELERREGWADALLDGLLARHPTLEPRERALTTALVYGVLRRRNLLDRLIEQAANRPLKKVHPKLLTLLRLGAFQIIGMDRIPNSAAVHETVAMTRQQGQGHASGFANAVLRRISERAQKAGSGGLLDGLAKKEDPIDRLGLECGLPRWLLEHWHSEQGVEGAEQLARATAQLPPLYLRLDTRQMSREDALASLQTGSDVKQCGLGGYAPEAIWAEGAGNPRALQLISDGHALVQGQASQLVTRLLDPQPGWRVLDACAAPGLKTSHIVRAMEGRGEVVALELHDHRARQTQELMDRLRATNVTVVEADAATFQDDKGFDAILVDAPCSGLGVLSHTPEKRWRLAPQELDRFPKLQRAILDNVAGQLRPGGVLVYSTCTTAQAENESIVEGFLADHKTFTMEAAQETGRIAPELCDEGGYLRTYPRPPAAVPDNHLDGFFAARLRRR